MTKNNSLHNFAALILLALLSLTACDGPQEATNEDADAQLQSRIERVLASTPDVPSALVVSVRDGRVTISGSLACEDCGGRQTPGTFGTIQQSLGAIVRAIPGVLDLSFSLTTDS